jgi:hypothetical protein
MPKQIVRPKVVGAGNLKKHICFSGTQGPEILTKKWLDRLHQRLLLPKIQT